MPKAGGRRQGPDPGLATSAASQALGEPERKKERNIKSHRYLGDSRVSETCNRLARMAVQRSTFYLWDEMNQLHNAGWMQNTRLRFEPVKHWESPETKRRLHTLLSISGILDQTTLLRARQATKDEIARVHVRSYIDQVEELSKDETKGHHTCGDRILGDAATFAPGGYEVACRAAGAAIVAADAVIEGPSRNGYVLMRPPGERKVQ